MNLRQIELLRAVVRCETTVRAAQELGLSQPAVSNAIKHLETQMQKAWIEPADLRGVPFIALERNTRMGTLLRQAFEAAGEPFEFSAELRYCNTACVRAGTGVAVVDLLPPLFAGDLKLATHSAGPASGVAASVVR